MRTIEDSDVEHLLESGFAVRDMMRLVPRKKGLAYIRRMRNASVALIREATGLAMPINVERLMQVVRDSEAFVEHDAMGSAYFMAGIIIQIYLGLDWFNKYVDTTGPSFFGTRNQRTDDIGSIRVIRLAESLINLDSVENFSSVRNKLLTDDPEPACAELESGALLSWEGIPFRFVEASGERGSDFDIEFNYAGYWIAADTKCKLSTTTRGAATISNSLIKHRNQLPADRPGAFLVSLPQEWQIDSTDHTIFDEARAGAEALFATGTGRIVTVIFFYRLYWQASDANADMTAVFHCDNPRRRFCKDVDFSQMLHANMPDSWVSLFSLARDITSPS